MTLNDSFCEEELQKLNNGPIPNFENNTYEREHIVKTLYVTDYIKIIACIVIILGGILGNISIILTVALNRSMRTTINYYVANLAIADVLICIFGMGPHLSNTLTYPVFALGEFMCKFNPFTQMVCLTASVLTLSVISCDRFVAIMFPLHVRITKQRRSIVMVIIWIISSIVSIPLLLIKRYREYQYKNFLEPICWETWPQESYYSKEEGACKLYLKYKFSYYLSVSITLYFLPVFLMITAYSLILWKSWISEVPGERSTQNMNVQYRARKKVIKMVFVVLLAFIMCWTPIEALLLLQTFEKTVTNQETFIWVAYFFAYANSFVNPIIYGGFNKTFRDGFRLFLKCDFRRNGINRPPLSKMTMDTTGV